MHRERKRIARDEIKRHLRIALKVYEAQPCLGRLYAYYAFSIVKRTRVRPEKNEKRLFCRKCLVPWIEGKTVRIEGNLYTCLKCGYARKL